MRYLRYLLLSIFSIYSFISQATHIRAGEVIARRVSNLTYEFTFTGYRDIEGVPFGQGAFDFGDGDFFGRLESLSTWGCEISLVYPPFREFFGSFMS